MADAFGENIIKLTTSEIWANQTIQIGLVGEKEFRIVQIDVSNWLTKYPNGIFSIVYQRPDGAVYPVEITMDNNIVSWNVTDTDLIVAGVGYIELRILIGDKIGKTSKVTTFVRKSLIAEDTPLAPQPDWVEKVIQSGADAVQSAADANIAKIAVQDVAQDIQNDINLAESYAIGGTGIRTGEDTDNSKYYKEQSANILENITSMVENGAGFGDMVKSTYDTNNNGVVNDSEKLGGQLPSYYAPVESIPTTLANLSSDINHRVVTDVEKNTWNNKQETLSGDVSNHYHTSDRNRGNHTGTQLASTISDFFTTVRATVLTGLSIATSAVISATDTILISLGKLQAQIIGLQTALDDKASVSHIHGSYNNSTPLTGANIYSNITIVNGIVTGLGARTLTASDINAAPINHTHPYVSKYVILIGNGVDTSFTISHNLNTRDIVVTAMEAESPYAHVMPDIKSVTVDTISVDFAVAPTTNQYRIIIIG